MSIAKELSEDLKKIVVDLLKQNPALRDDDKKLCARIWVNQVGGKQNAQDVSMYAFLVNWTMDKSPLYSQESIGRCRRQSQEMDATLRGLKWKERHEHQKEVKKKLGYENNLQENYQAKAPTGNDLLAQKYQQKQINP